MKRSYKVVGAGALALGLAAVAAIGIGGSPSVADQWRHGGGHHGICGHDMAAEIEGRADELANELALTEAQRPAWDAALGAVDAALASRRDLCESLADKGRPETVVERLERAEMWLTPGLEHLRAIRAAVGDLYGVLDEDQRGTLDGMVMKHRHGRG